MKRTISGYILSSLLALHAFSGIAQSEPKPVTTNGLRIGVDGGHAIMHQIFPERRGWEVVADYQYNRKWFIATEFGYQTVDVEELAFSYDLSGSYYKLGFDYDILKSPQTDDIVTFGIRYATAFYKHQANNIVINNYWGDLQETISEDQFNAHWLELVFGMKTELWFVKNVFLGWSIRAGVYLWGQKDERMDAFVIPGFGSGDKNLGVNFNWTLSYRIPFKKEVIQQEKRK